MLRPSELIPLFHLLICLRTTGTLVMRDQIHLLRPTVNTSLSSLYMSSISVGVDGGHSLALACRVNTSLSSLNSCDNFIGDEGANSLDQD